MKRLCINCNKFLSTRDQLKFCSNKCQQNFKYIFLINLWKNHSKNGINKIQTKNISKHIKRYLLEKHGAKCSRCGWNEKHPISGLIPVEIDHIDGNAQNNIEANLRILCPNCHSLTNSYRNLNNGKGRKWRTDRK